ncbi:MAG: TetR family transcriptional regulator [Acidimicrobiales bacterium]|nr:TetR family transcriptional regulator [Acidimicrobiales bacterium]
MPRAGLTNTNVVKAAQEMIDEAEASPLTLAALAARLGVKQPSLYKHIDGMDDLRRSIAVRAKLELAGVMARAAVGKAGADAITSMSLSYRTWAAAHPGRYAATVRAPAAGDADDESASAEITKVAFEIMSGIGLQGDDAVDAIRGLRAVLHGFVTLEAGGAFGLPADIDRSFDRLIAGLVTTLTDWVRS